MRSFRGLKLNRFRTSWLYRLLVEIVWLLSECEALMARPNSRLIFRRGYLRLLQVETTKHLWIGRAFRLYNPSNFSFGDRCAIGDHARITNHAPISIGEDFISASGLHIDSGTHDIETLTPAAKPVRIGSRVWCGVDVTVIAGVSIGDDVVIGAGAVVTRDIPSKSVAVGVPARVVKTLNRDPHAKLWTWVESY